MSSEVALSEATLNEAEPMILNVQAALPSEAQTTMMLSVCTFLRVTPSTTVIDTWRSLRKRLRKVREQLSKLSNLDPGISRMVSELSKIVDDNLRSACATNAPGKLSTVTEDFQTIELTDGDGNFLQGSVSCLIPFFEGYCLRIVRRQEQAKPQLIAVIGHYVHVLRYAQTRLGAELRKFKDEKGRARAALHLGDTGRIHMTSVYQGNPTLDIYAKAQSPEYLIDTMYGYWPKRKQSAADGAHERGEVCLAG